MSQGVQTVPIGAEHVVMNLAEINDITVDTENNLVTVGAGATWEQVQL